MTRCPDGWRSRRGARPRPKSPCARLGISRRVRFEILNRDRFTCLYCGRRAPHVQLEIDHVIPVTLGGATEAGNLATACYDCNQGKFNAVLRCLPEIADEYLLIGCAGLA